MSEEIKNETPTEPVATESQNNDSNPDNTQTTDNTPDTTKNPEISDSKKFIQEIMDDIEKEDKIKQDSIKEETDSRTKELLKEGFKEFANQKKQLVDQIAKQNELIETLKTNFDNQTSGSKITNPPQDNIQNDVPQGIDKNDDNQVEEIFREKFNLI